MRRPMKRCMHQQKFKKYVRVLDSPCKGYMPCKDYKSGDDYIVHRWAIQEPTDLLNIHQIGIALQ